MFTKFKERVFRHVTCNVGVLGPGGLTVGFGRLQQLQLQRARRVVARRRRLLLAVHGVVFDIRHAST